MKLHLPLSPALPLLLAAFGLAAAPQEPAARFENVPARALGASDLKLEILAPLSLDDLEGRMSETKLDLAKADDLARLRELLSGLSALAQKQDAYKDAHPERYLPFAHHLATSGKRRALREALPLVDALQSDGGARDDATMLHLLELVHAIQNGFRYPVEKDHQLIPEIVPALLLQMRAHLTLATPDASSVVPDPPASSFWRDPRAAAAGDLHAGFGRPAIPRYDEPCEYLSPKTGWGAHPGFDVRCGERELTFKLGNEIYGGPFNSRVFHALGYPTTPIDPVRRLRLRYDRRVLTQYNSRKRLAMHARLLFIRVFTHVITDIEDPFARIDRALMNDGSRLSAAELKQRLLRDHRVLKGRPRPETLEANYDAEFERGIAELVWQPGTAEEESKAYKPVGAWDYDQLDHAARREVRALFVLAAWLDQFNLRWENTRLAYVQQDGRWLLRHLLSDVGSGMGLAKDLRHHRNSDVEGMLWEVTERQGDDRVRFSGFAPNVGNDAFAALSGEDALWMLRRIGRLSERQILSALLATSMSAAEVRLALEKLLSKRRKMLEDFGLLREFPELASRSVHRGLDFDPRDPGQLAQVSLDTPSGTVVPDVGAFRVRAGHLEAWGTEITASAR